MSTSENSREKAIAFMNEVEVVLEAAFTSERDTKDLCRISNKFLSYAEKRDNFLPSSYLDFASNRIKSLYRKDAQACKELEGFFDDVLRGFDTETPVLDAIGFGLMLLEIWKEQIELIKYHADISACQDNIENMVNFLRKLMVKKFQEQEGAN